MTLGQEFPNTTTLLHRLKKPSSHHNVIVGDPGSSQVLKLLVTLLSQQLPPIG